MGGVVRLVFTSAYAMPLWVKVEFEVGGILFYSLRIFSFHSSKYVDCFFFSLSFLFY